MKNFAEKLQKEIREKIDRIEAEDKNILKKSLDSSLVLGNAFERLKTFISQYSFKDEEEEIYFFKEVKPKLFCYLIYYRKVYNIEIDRPVATIEKQKEYLRCKLDSTQEYQSKILDFYRYYRSGGTCSDSIYFTRENPDMEQFLDSFYYERDPNFSTIYDFKVAKILANDMLQAYLLCELDSLDNIQGKSIGALPKVKLTWTGTKTDLVELIYALDTAGCFNHGKVMLNQIVTYFECVFNIDLGSNVSRTFSDIRIRQELTSFLDRLREEIKKRIKKNRPGKKDWKDE
ncbi:RteC domain-containing protein [Bacteroides sp. 224]|uniref:RteC domain-containing protein n=1 Tax=Bacteroides sp. 224 TaxID=2302936 RepID=UPI0013D0E536|nr:RteC domain-containing protein [Bacteroides sp. 224]NDV64632.1 RteC protein [Bacteroides sp. 224]